ncbi:MAG: DUF4349 domain-containing protein [Chloroflexi bacterium]|nr:DUF4349 domain-containing protein [Chloroflexota bacterium]
MKRLTLGLAIILFFAIFAIGCSKSSPERSDSFDGGKSGAAPAPPRPVTSTMTKTAATTTTAVGGPKAPEQPSTGDRLIIRTATVEATADDVVGAVERVSQLAAQMGGYVVSSKTWGQGKRQSGAISIRVPAEQFDATMRSLRGMVTKVTSEDISSKDVSDEYVDLQSRLRNLEATEQQLLRFMGQARTVDETLNVQRELTRVRGDIEQTRGRMQFLERSSSTSLINVNLQGTALDAEFSAPTTEVKTGVEIRFSDMTSGGEPPYTYEWSFGDGKTSELKNPIHEYADPGIYTVSLRITDSRGVSDIETKKALINVTRGPGWEATGVFEDAKDALVAVSQALFTLAVYVLFLAPFWGTALAIVLVLRRRKRRA